jgi:hypothetical protein
VKNFGVLLALVPQMKSKNLIVQHAEFARLRAKLVQ